MRYKQSPFDDAPDASAGQNTARPLTQGLSNHQLSELCYRLAVSLESGIDIRKVLAGEAERASGRRQKVFQSISESVAAGDSIAKALKPWLGYFPRLFVTMLSVGEATGTMTDVLRRLSKYYEHQREVTRNLLAQLAWPIMQLAIALAIVAIIILLGGLIEIEPGKPLDLLGFGLVGSTGFIVYACFLGSMVLALLLVYRYLSRRPKLRDSWAERCTSIPVIGLCLEKFALSRIAWAMHLAMNTDLDLRKMVPLVLGVSQNRRYAKHIPFVVDSVDQGQRLSSAMVVTGDFPREFTDALIVAEESGTIVESMQRLSNRYQEEAESAMSTLSTIFAMVIWGLVGCFVILLIFRVFSFYTGVLNEALEMI